MPISAEDASGTPLDPILAAVREQTHQLLGRTIAYSAEDWAAPSRLPGWTRSHVAAHLVQNARDLLARAAGRPVDDDPGRRRDLRRDLELAALADGLTLQVRLDESAGALDEAMAALPEGSDLPLIRLHEVVLHAFDLDPEADRLDLDPEPALTLLRFELTRGRSVPDGPLRLVSPSGDPSRVTLEDALGTVTGPVTDVLLWLARSRTTGRLTIQPPTPSPA